MIPPIGQTLHFLMLGARLLESTKLTTPVIVRLWLLRHMKSWAQ